MKVLSKTNHLKNYKNVHLFKQKMCNLLCFWATNINQACLSPVYTPMPYRSLYHIGFPRVSQFLLSCRFTFHIFLTDFSLAIFVWCPKHLNWNFSIRFIIGSAWSSFLISLFWILSLLKIVMDPPKI